MVSLSGSKVYVAGHRGLVGSAIVRALHAKEDITLVVRDSHQLDLRDSAAVRGFFQAEKPEYVFLAAAKVGGILANSLYPADFIYDNLMIEANVIDSAYRFGVKKLLFLGSSCIYPKHAPQPMKESYLLTGPLEPTNEWYAVAKIAGIKLCQAYNNQYGTNFVTVMPTNLYGPNDNFDLSTSHVLPALIRNFHEAKERNEASVTIWGSGTPRREFLHVDDLADACLFVMKHYQGNEPLNIGTGRDIRITDLAYLVKEIVGYQGRIVYDRTKPDGMPQKLLDVSRISNLGWTPTISLREGIRRTYRWYVDHLGRNESVNDGREWF